MRWWWTAGVVGLAACSGDPTRVGSAKEPVSVPRVAPELPVPTAVSDRVLRIGSAVGYGDDAVARAGAVLSADALVAASPDHAALFDRDPTSAWCAPWSADGVRLTFALPRPLVALGMLGGAFADVDGLGAHGRVAQARVELAGTQVQSWELTDPLWGVAGDERPARLLDAQRTHPAWLALSAPLDAPTVDVVIASVFAARARDVCLSELELRVAE